MITNDGTLGVTCPPRGARLSSAAAFSSIHLGALASLRLLLLGTAALPEGPGQATSGYHDLPAPTSTYRAPTVDLLSGCRGASERLPSGFRRRYRSGVLDLLRAHFCFPLSALGCIGAFLDNRPSSFLSPVSTRARASADPRGHLNAARTRRADWRSGRAAPGVHRRCRAR